MKNLKLLAAAVFLVGTAACSSPQKKSDATADPTNPAEEGPQCFDGCMLDSQGECNMQGKVMDWSSSDTETIACDPRCCQGAPTVSGRTDADDDGVFNDADKCPDQKEDRDNFQDEDGCEDLDNDGDAISDIDDVCPLDAEDVDGYQDEDGCPDP